MQLLKIKAHFNTCKNIRVKCTKRWNESWSEWFSHSSSSISLVKFYRDVHYSLTNVIRASSSNVSSSVEPRV